MKDIRSYVDTEYIYPGMTKDSGRPTSKDRREIVQIAAVNFDGKKGVIIESFNTFIKPTLTPFIPSFFTDLTGITEDELRCGVSFHEATNLFRKFTKHYPIWTFDKDYEVFKQNYAMHKKPFPFDTPFIRVKSLLPSLGVDPNAYSSGTLYKAAGLDLSGHVHNALHDVSSMTVAVHVLEKRVLLKQ